MRKFLVTVVLLAACGTDSATGDDTRPPSGIVYYGQVDRILNQNCAGCHSSDPDRLAPFSLATYADAVDAAKNQAVSNAINTRQMPPYYATNDGSCGAYTSEWLSDDDLQTLTAWFNGDQPEGDASLASGGPPAPIALDHTDTTLDPGADYLPPNDGSTDLYRCFVVDPHLTTDKFLTGDFVHPKNNLIVHHVVLFTLPDAAAEQQAMNLDAQDPDLGYTCFGGPGVTNATFLTGWVPGQTAVLFPSTTGVRVPGGRKLVMQVHYNLINSDGAPDRTTIDLQFADTVGYEAKLVNVSGAVDLQPHQADALAVETRTLPAMPLRMWGSVIHMHTRGTKAHLVDMGNSSCLIDLAHWSFHWQNFYWTQEPVPLDSSSQVQLTCHYDTTNDTQEVKFGEKTSDEMCVAFLYLTQ